MNAVTHEMKSISREIETVTCEIKVNSYEMKTVTHEMESNSHEMETITCVPLFKIRKFFLISYINKSIAA